MHKEVRILGSDKIYQDTYSYVLVDDQLRRHTVQINERLLQVEPKEFQRQGDKEHLDILAAGAVLLCVDPTVTFHRVDAEMVDRAYEAASQVKSIYQLGAAS